MDRLSRNDVDIVAMGWQDWAVLVIGVAVVVAALYRAWRVLFCGYNAGCDGCTKECRRRKG